MQQFQFKPVKDEQIVSVQGWFVWCGSMVRTPDGKCHLFLSMWEEKWGFEYGWATHSKIGYAIAEKPDGKYEFQRIIFEGSGKATGWDRDSVHNPYAIYHDGIFYIYYSGNHGNGVYDIHTGNQQIGIACAKNPLEEWTRFDEPLYENRIGKFDESGTTNPSVCKTPDGRFCMIYKCWSYRLPYNGKVSFGIAFADHPMGPWKREDITIFDTPRALFAAEDPCVYIQGGKFYCILKDMGNFYIPDRYRTMIRFESKDGFEWKPADTFFFRSRNMQFEGKGEQLLFRMERPFLYLENDEPKVFFTAILPKSGKPFSCNVHMNIKYNE